MKARNDGGIRSRKGKTLLTQAEECGDNDVFIIRNSRDGVVHSVLAA